MTQKLVRRIVVVMLAMVFIVSTSLCEQTIWDCPGCERTGNTGNFCGGCGHPAPTSSSTPGQEIEIGQSIFFGHYPQTADGKDNTPIEWRVLDVDEGKNQALVISKYGLDAHRFHETRWCRSWASSEIRGWLNSTFIKKAFTAKERKGIVTTKISKDSYGDSDTMSKIWLLSKDEVVTYFRNEKTSETTIPTKYAVAQGACSYKLDGTGCCRWWLRSHGHTSIASCVNEDGGLSDVVDIYRTDIAVRPVLWLDLDLADFK